MSEATGRSTTHFIGVGMSPLREDKIRECERTMANNFGWLKRFALGMLKHQEDKYSIAMRRRVAGWNLNYLAKALGIPVLECVSAVIANSI